MAFNPGAVIKQLKAVEGLEHVPLAGGRMIAQNAQKKAPVDTGYLKSKIRARAGKKSVVVESPAPYSVHVEFGTWKMAAQPFMRPAIDEHRRQILEVEKAAVEAEIQGLIRR